VRRSIWQAGPAVQDMQRKDLLELVPVAVEYLTELMHRRPRVWARDVTRLRDLLERYGDNALATFRRGLAEPAIGAYYIAHYLSASTPRSPKASGPVQQELPL
jgi:hypothetical protein